MTANDKNNLPVIGWRERVALPELGIVSVKAKIDTGARSSAIHAFDIEMFEREGAQFVRFKVHPSQRHRTKIVTAEAPLLDQRTVRNSGGKSELRPVISTTVRLGDQQWPIELTLTNRKLMGFRMLLGREGVRRRFLVDSGKSYLQSSQSKRKLKSRKKQKNENSNIVKKLFSLFDASS